MWFFHRRCSFPWRIRKCKKGLNQNVCKFCPSKNCCSFRAMGCCHNVGLINDGASTANKVWSPSRQSSLPGEFFPGKLNIFKKTNLNRQKWPFFQKWPTSSKFPKTGQKLCFGQILCAKILSAPQKPKNGPKLQRKNEFFWISRPVYGLPGPQKVLERAEQWFFLKIIHFWKNN